jgi:cell division septation protein DedD
MTRTGRNDSEKEQAETATKPKRYRLELGFKELIFYGFSLLLALSWMFVFGILVGRGIPLVSSEEISVRAHLLRFLGLGPQMARESQPEAEEHFDSPRDMLSTLNYYKDLTQKSGEGAPALRPLQTMPTPAPKQPPAEASTSKQKSAPAQQSRPADTPSIAPPPASATETGPPEHLSEHFSLLISSMKEAENAQRLLEQLRGKGYTPRIETVNLGGSGRWNRVLIGYFANREEAMRFAAEFNRKERMEALVVRESR